MISPQEFEHIGKALAHVSSIIHLEKEVSREHLYTKLEMVMSLKRYNIIIECLKRAGLIEEINYMLKWKGPGQ